MSERTARRLEGKGTLPSQHPRRYWRSRPDPFADGLGNGGRAADQERAGVDGDHVAAQAAGRASRTVSRRHAAHAAAAVRQWRALEGPDKEVFFPQAHAPGERGLSDFTAMGELRVTIAGARFAHICCITSYWRSRAGSTSKWSRAARASRRCPGLAERAVAGRRRSAGAPHRQSVGRVQEPAAGRRLHRSLHGAARALRHGRHAQQSAASATRTAASSPRTGI